MNMPLSPSWQEICLRLALTLIAGAIIGFNRGARGHAAGFRTTILVGLAASVAMIQTNILLPLAGKTSESFAVMDLMRLPLGILTGVGFIGGGTILKKGDLVTGVTTAATIWVMTVIGLCLGGGQLTLGIATTALAVITLWFLKWVDVTIPREHRAVMVVTADNGWSTISELPLLIGPLKCRAHFRERRPARDPAKAEFCFEVSWRRPEQSVPPLELLQRVSERYAVISFAITSENGR
jgi:putative Mg2+ transporter-C (MgtC) family protein